jgi:hypothetical protein
VASIEYSNIRHKVIVNATLSSLSRELDHVIKQVLELAVDRTRPELAGFDFTGIEPGDFSVSFSRSELRQRIEKTSSILGVDFAARSANMSMSMGTGMGAGKGLGMGEQTPFPLSLPSSGLSPLEGDCIACIDTAIALFLRQLFISISPFFGISAMHCFLKFLKAMPFHFILFIIIDVFHIFCPRG